MYAHFQLLVLVGIANYMPVVGHLLFKGRFAWPVDGGRTLADGRPLFGPSKTWRGLLFSVLGSLACVAAWARPLPLGLLVAAAAMAGDLLSSFAKRRLGRASGSMALGLDQIPESLLPFALARDAFGLGWLDVLALTGAFLVLELALSRVLYRLHLRQRPY